MKRWITKGIILICVVVIFFSPSLGANAQTRSTSVQEPTELYIFSGNFTQSDHPFTFKNIDIKDLQEKLSGQEPSYLLSTTPNITSYSDSGAYQGYSYFRLRGIDQARINMTLDGVPLNEPEDQGVYFSNYPDFFSSINKVQLARGVGTTQNGSASYGGSIRFESADLKEPRRLNLGVGSGSFGSYRTFAEYNSGLVDTKGVYLRAAEIHSNGYKKHSGNDSQSVFYKIGSHERGDDWTLSGFVGRQANELAWIGSPLEEIQKDRSHNANSDQEDDQFLQTLVQVKNDRSINNGDQLTSSVYYNHLVGNYDFDLNNFLGLPQTEELYNYHYNSDLLGAFTNYKLNLNQSQVTFGIHGNVYEREHLGSERTLGRLYENTGRKKEISAFTQVERYIGDFILLADVEARHTSFDYVGNANLQSLEWNFLNPKIGLSYLLSSTSNFYYSVGKTGREPTRNDILAGSDDLITDDQSVPVLGTTSPEHVIDHEIGVRSKGETWSFQGNGYYMDFDQEIVLSGELGPNGLPLTQSVGRSYRSGAEVDLNWAPTSKLSLTTNASYNLSRIHEGDQSFVPVVTPRFLLNQGIKYKLNNLTLGAGLRYQSSSYIDFANTTELNDFFVVDLNASYEYKELLFGIQINNALNEDYFSNGYVDGAGTARYFTQAPANIYFTVTWKY